MNNRPVTSLLLVSIFILPVMLAFVPVSAEESVEEGWWIETTVDRNGNGIGDMVE